MPVVQIPQRFSQRYDTAANWATKNPVLWQGEIGFESDTGLGKDGDGVTPWNSLLYTHIGRVDLSGLAPGKVLVRNAANDGWIVGDGGGGGGGVHIDDRVPTYADLPSPPASGMTTYLVEADGLVYVWDGSAWPAEGDGEPISSRVPWNPSNGMANYPQIWIDPNLSDLVATAAGAVIAINNHTSQGYSFAPSSSSASRPALVIGGLNGRNTMTFNGTTQFLQGIARSLDFMNAVGGHWGIAVIRKLAVDSTVKIRRFFNVLTSGGATQSALCVGLGSTPNRIGYTGRTLSGDAAYTYETTTDLDTVWHIIFFSISLMTGALEIWMDGAQIGSDTATTTKGLSTGSNAQAGPTIGSYFAGGTLDQPMDMELALYVGSNATIPRGGDLDKLFGWAAHETGLTSVLPSGHPYKISPPYL